MGFLKTSVCFCFSGGFALHYLSVGGVSDDTRFSTTSLSTLFSPPPPWSFCLWAGYTLCAFMCAFVRPFFCSSKLFSFPVLFGHCVGCSLSPLPTRLNLIISYSVYLFDIYFPHPLFPHPSAYPPIYTSNTRPPTRINLPHSPKHPNIPPLPTYPPEYTTLTHQPTRIHFPHSPPSAHPPAHPTCVLVQSAAITRSTDRLLYRPCECRVATAYQFEL